MDLSEASSVQAIYRYEGTSKIWNETSWMIIKDSVNPHFEKIICIAALQDLVMFLKLLYIKMKLLHWNIDKVSFSYT